MTKIGVRLDRYTDEHAWSATLRISDETDLTVYDAAYLELALRLKLPLATLDIALGQAARSENVVVLGASAGIGQ